MTKIAWVEAPAGISGDMFLGALVDAGLPLAVLQEVVQGLGLSDVEVRAGQVMRGAISATKVDVCRGGRPIEGKDDLHRPVGAQAGHRLHEEEHGHDHAHGHRTLAEVLHLIGHLGSLDQAPLDRAAATFRHLAEAEARVHGTTVEAVHFHEVGAADALVDIVGTCVGLHHLGVEAVHVSTLPWGSGTVQTQHGAMPIPAPATVRLLEGWPTTPSGETYEQVTPTGAALVRALARDARMPAGFTPRQVGHGAGTHAGGRLPNVLRLVLGDLQETPHEDEVVLLETNLDDVSGQVVAHTLEQALSAGALDAWWTPIHMKTGRPGILLSLLVSPDQVPHFEGLLFKETPTLGVRRRVLARTVLERRFEEVETPWGPVRLKVRMRAGEDAATPEYEDCRKIALVEGVAVHAVQEAARAAWHRLRDAP
jgi:uncharacterized protein (TIGR00299 family) protein